MSRSHSYSMVSLVVLFSTLLGAFSAEETLEARRTRLMRKYLSDKVVIENGEEVAELNNQTEMKLLEDSKQFKQSEKLLNSPSSAASMPMMMPRPAPTQKREKSSWLFSKEVDVKDAFAEDRAREKAAGLSYPSLDDANQTEYDANAPGDWLQAQRDRRAGLRTGQNNSGYSSGEETRSAFSSGQNSSYSRGYRSSFDRSTSAQSGMQTRYGTAQRSSTGMSAETSGYSAGRNRDTAGPAYTPYSGRSESRSITSRSATQTTPAHSAYSTLRNARGSGASYTQSQSTQTRNKNSQQNHGATTTWKKSYNQDRSRPEELDRILGQ